MKHTRLAFVLAIATLMTTPAIAASVTMLQFGSFETREEAEKRLSDIKGKYAAKLGNLPASVREVKMPPDLVVYRTQAGPVESRSAAQSICTQIASTGEECYIVQTAMVADAKPASGSTPAAPELKDTPATAAVASTAPTPDFLPNKFALAKTPEAATTAVTEEKAEAKADVTSRLSSMQNYSVRDASSRQMLSNVHSSLSTQQPAPVAATSSAVIMDATPATSPELESALDKAAAEQSAAVTNVDHAAAAEGATRKPVERSFWSRLNPFSDDEKMAPTPNPVETAAAPIAAPIEPVAAAAAEPPLELIAAPVPLKAEISSAPLVAQAPVQDAAPVIATPPEMRLPPPPAPLSARPMAAPAAVVAKPEPVTIGNIAPPGSPGSDNVSVEEAKRVPVTQSPVIVPSAPMVAIAPKTSVPVIAPTQPPVSLVPGSTVGQKTIWAQIGPFPDSASALAFWANYRQAYPDFPVVRVRAVTPYQQQLRGSAQSWLRIGPIIREGFVKSLCVSLPPKSNLQCGRVADLGVAESALGKGTLRGSRYKR